MAGTRLLTVEAMAAVDAAAIAGGFDCAILDINIRGGNSYQVASMLLARGCPFVLATGYGGWSLPHDLVGEKKLTKPYSSWQLMDELRLMQGRVEALRQGGSDARS